ncbi:hypothetical protein C0216_24905 [Streptomyces globosus]|uniref:Uncharacterized protein n=1 Tax=Streptomyces globosus TaxID=68209 RepID=A0A344U5U8_9ACTN|nr:hypothetical protein [Streptomyces globosus]AXE26269.1 hypothetical protein C0216_24905 [Streptomyces globosus]
MPDWIHPVLTGAFLAVSYRVVRRSGVGLRAAVLVLAVLNAGLLWVVAAAGPPWGVPVVAVVSLAAAVYHLFGAARDGVARIRAVGPTEFRALVRQVAEASGPQVMGVCVLVTGSVALTALADDSRPEGRRFQLLPGPECPFCLVEEQIRDFLGPSDPLLDEYRTHLTAGSSRHLLVRRPSEQEPWTGRLRDRSVYRVPPAARRPPCTVHDPLLGRG